MIETRSAATAITLATLRGHQSAESDHKLYGCRIQRKGAGGSSGEVAHGVDCGRVLAAVDRQRLPVMRWLYFAYAEPVWEWMTDAGMCNLHAELTLKCEPWVGSQSERAERLAATAMHDKRVSKVRGHQYGFPNAEYTRCIGLDRSAWRRIEPVVTALRDTLDDWDAEGLKAVAAEIRQNDFEAV